MKKHYTLKEAADILGIDYQALYMRIYRDSSKPKSKQFYPDAIKLGRDWFIPVNKLKKK